VKNKLCNVLEIQEKNLIIVSYSKYKHVYDSNIDYTLWKYLILIIDSKHYQIILNLFDLIEAEQLFYFGNNALFDFDLRHFYKLNLKYIK